MRAHCPREMEGLCEEFVHSRGEGVAQTISSDILLGKSDILQLVQTLGVYLTSTNVDTRSSAVKLLSLVLESLGSVQLLVPEDVHYLVQFYSDRLKDHAVVLPHVLTGLHALVTGQGIAGSDALLISRCICKEVYCQFEERNQVFRIFHLLVTKQLPALVEFSEGFVLGYIQLLDGERDPRNLLLAFNSVQVIIQNLPLDALVDDLFEVIACYFPIDFTPPPNDPTAVSREVLVDTLKHCLAASPKFAKACLPQLLEKLSSDVLTAKLDSLHVLVAAAPVYGPVAMGPFLEQLWTIIEREMFRVTSMDFQLACVSAVKAIASSLSLPLHSSHLQGFISLALQNLKLLEPAVQLLCGITMASGSAAMGVLPQVMPRLLKQCAVTPQISNRIVLLNAMKSFIEAVSSAGNMDAVSPLIGCKDLLLGWIQAAFQQSGSDASVKSTVLLLSSVFAIPNLLTHSEVVGYSQQLRRMVTDTKLQGPVSSALQSVCKSYPAIVEEHLISPTLAELETNPDKAWLLATLSPTPALAEVVLPAVVALLQQLTSSYNRAVSVQHCWDRLLPLSSALLSVVQCNPGSAPLSLQSLKALLLLSHQNATVHWKCCEVEVNTFIENISGSLFCNTQHATDRWCNDSIEAMVGVLVPEPSQPFPSVPPSCLCLPLLSALIGAAPVAVIGHWSKQLCEPMLKLALLNQTFKPAVRVYASILNKYPDGEDLYGWINNHMCSLWKQISILEPPPDIFTADFSGPLAVWIWMTKALVMRSHQLGLPAALKLLELCCRTDSVGARAANGFKLVLLDEEDFLSRASHANVKLFYKQFLFVNILPELVHKVAECRKQHLLKCLAHFIVGVPQQVILEELPKVLPLLLESLCSLDSDVKLATLTGLLSILTETPVALSNHVGTLISHLLSLSHDRSSMAIRKTAVQCVECLSSLPAHLIYPHQRQVLKGLAACLDDHKRLVRKAAVDARAKWFLL